MKKRSKGKKYGPGCVQSVEPVESDSGVQGEQTDLLLFKPLGCSAPESRQTNDNTAHVYMVLLKLILAGVMSVDALSLHSAELSPGSEEEPVALRQHLAHKLCSSSLSAAVSPSCSSPPSLCAPPWAEPPQTPGSVSPSIHLPVTGCGSDADCEKITPALLKGRTGEFDLESILFLKLRGLGIHDLGCIGECVNLEKLDLSGNNITNLVSLTSLRLLSVLNLSANRISNLEPLRSCDSLQNLNVAGNIISSIESLHCLQPLRKLENIRFKDNTYNYTNPVCRNASYRTIVLEMFSNIKVLDGERVVGRGSDLYQLCKDIDDTIKAGLYKNGQLVERPDCKPWVEDSYWEIKRSNNAIIEEAYKQFNDVLHECRLLNNRATHVISQTERSMSLKKQPKQYAI